MSTEVNLDQDLVDVEMSIRTFNCVEYIDSRLKDHPVGGLQQLKTRRDLSLLLQNCDIRRYRGVGHQRFRELHEIAGLFVSDGGSREIRCPHCDRLFNIHK